MHATLPLLVKSTFPQLRRGQLETLQVNLGYRCNQSCVHCHVNAGPKRTEEMSAGNVDLVIDFLTANRGVGTLDLTGGAPEMNPHFKRLVLAAGALGVRVMDRCNLTILEEPGFEDMASFLAANRVEIVASLPCYQEDNVDRQRGKGTFEASIRALQRLNALGYGDEEGRLVLNLVYNPQGAALPPPQDSLERAYKTHLAEAFGVVFNRLFTITNMPIQRFGSTLISKGQFDTYMSLLKHAHQANNLDGVMCRKQLSIDWQGFAYDCDFNQQLGLGLISERPRVHLSELSATGVEGRPIRVADHCFGCTAGQGSSCGGALET